MTQLPQEPNETGNPVPEKITKELETQKTSATETNDDKSYVESKSPNGEITTKTNTNNNNSTSSPSSNETALVPAGPKSSTRHGVEPNNKKSNSSPVSTNSGFVGLSNQGATCYLNSLIQALFMTPEIRQMVYQYKYNEEDGSPEECIPLQLQRLFATLQLSNRRVAETRSLTKSFGWDARDSFVQHDVQELLRVLFDALDETLGEDNKVSDMHTGTLIDYIREKNGSHGSSREDTFMDIQLVVRGGVKSVEEALNNYIKPEELSGDNKWYCEEIDAKVDATKGLQFKKLPYLLTLQLKRFDYDYVTWQRIKLSNRVEFPTQLDMTPYLAEEDREDEQYLYDLYAVLIHSGSAHYGHYYAYIKSFETGKWYNFNDSSVREISEKDLERVYGDESKSASSYRSSTNAYMLMYRRHDPERNMNKITSQDIPQEIRDEFARLEEQEEKERIERKKRLEEAKRKMTLRIVKDSKSKNLEVDNTMTKKELIEYVWKELVKEDGYDFDQIRLREYSTYTFAMGKVIEPDDETLSKSTQFYNFKSLCIETREKDEDFLPENALALQICLYDPEIDDFKEPIKVVVDKNDTLQQLKEEIANKIDADPASIRVIKNNSLNTVLKNDKKKLTHFYLESNNPKLFAEVLDDESLTEESKNTPALKKIEERKNRVQLNFNKPVKPGEEPVYDQKITYDSRKTIGELKEDIGKMLELNISEFRVADEFNKKKDIPDKSKINTSRIRSRVYIELGRPLAEDEYKIRLFSFEPENDGATKKEPEIENNNNNEDNDDNVQNGQEENNSEQKQENDAKEKEQKSTTEQRIAALQNQFKLQDEIVVKQQLTFGELLEEIEKVCEVEHFCLREKQSRKLGKIIVAEDSAKLREALPNIHFYGVTDVVVQPLDEPVEYTQSHLVLNIQQWHPSQWKFERRHEIVIDAGKNKERKYSYVSKPVMNIKKEDKGKTTNNGNDQEKIQENGNNENEDMEHDSPEKTFDKGTVGQLKQTISQMSGMPFDRIAIATPPSNWLFWDHPEQPEVVLLNWKHKDEQYLVDSPLFLSDGDTVFWKDIEEEEKVPLSKVRSMTQNYSTETALKIRVKKKKSKSPTPGSPKEEGEAD